MLNKCPICNSLNLSTITNYPRRTDNVFYTQIINCDHCNSGIALPYKNQSELNDYYSSGAYWEGVSSPNLSIHNFAQAKFRVKYVLKKSKLNKVSLDVLDVGAGHGYIAEAFNSNHLKNLKNYFFIEPDQALSASILKRFKVATKIDSHNESFSYDMIFLNHILEHTASPLETLKTYADKLNSGGIIYIEVPNRDDTFKDDVFPHSVFFSEKGIREIIEQSGLKCLMASSFGSLDSIKRPTSLPMRLRIKILNRFFALSVKYNLIKSAQWLDEAIFSYGTARKNGIWIRAICTISKDG